MTNTWQNFGVNVLLIQTFVEYITNTNAYVLHTDFSEHDPEANIFTPSALNYKLEDVKTYFVSDLAERPLCDYFSTDLLWK